MKIFGSLFIILASTIATIFYERKLKETIKYIDELYKLVLHIKNKIEYFSLSINEIYLDYYSQNDLINKGKNGNWDFSCIDKELARELSDFFNSLGKGYKKEQISLCDYLAQKLFLSKETLSKETPKKIKIFRSLSYFIGFGLVILLI